MTTMTALNAEGLAQNYSAAASVAEACAGRASVLEMKLDGWRILIEVAEEGVRLYSRTAKRYDGRLLKLEAEIAERFPVGTWLDGEAVALRVEGDKVFNDWGAAQSALSSGKPNALADDITYMVFDLIAHGGIDARSLPFRTRRELLERIFEDAAFERVQLTTQMEPTEENYEALLAAGFEGGIVKHLDEPYRSGKRVGGKLKAQHPIDAVVVGYKPGKGSFAGMVGAIEFGQYQDGELVSRGFCSGMDMRTRQKISADPQGWLGRVIEVRHMGRMPSGGLRHPQFSRLRLDKLASECVLSDV